MVSNSGILFQLTSKFYKFTVAFSSVMSGTKTTLIVKYVGIFYLTELEVTDIIINKLNKKRSRQNSGPRKLSKEFLIYLVTFCVKIKSFLFHSCLKTTDITHIYRRVCLAKQFIYWMACYNPWAISRVNTRTTFI